MNNYRIMLLDHQNENLEQLYKALTSAGYSQIEVFLNLDDAFSRFQSEKFHIVLLDIGNCDADSIDLLIKLKGFDPLTQFIVMSENSTISTILTCLELGVSDYLTKPIKATNDVLEALQHSIRKLERWKTALRESVVK